MTLKAGGAKPTSVSLAFPTPSNVTDGDYFILAKVDETNGISESDETNNVAATASTVQIRQPFVDLSATVSVVPGTVTIAAGKKAKPPKVALVMVEALA